MLKRPCPRAIKQRCENCPAHNRRVQVVRWEGRDVALCPECIAAAKRVAASKAA